MSLSPMMQQYLQTKEQYKDTILFYRLGDFYELFFEDAEICSRILGLTLTSRSCGGNKKAPMCGVPYHSVEPYIAKLINEGLKIAICEQLTAPKKGEKLVKRDVVRIITPGTIVDSEILQTANNFICSIYKEKLNIGISYIDISTGEFYTTEFNDINSITKLNDFLAMIIPNEIICNEGMAESINVLSAANTHLIPKFLIKEKDYFDFDNSVLALKTQFNLNSLISSEYNNKKYSIISSAALLFYIRETQKRELPHINNLKYIDTNKYLQLDANTRRNLELTENLKDGKKRGTILGLLDKTRTSMGSRKLKDFIDLPLYDEFEINNRQQGIEELTKNIVARDKLSKLLYNIYDIERLSGKISYGNLTPKDCLSLKNSLKIIPEIKEILNDFQSNIICNLNKDISLNNEVIIEIEKAINESNVEQLNIKDGGYIKSGYNRELDELINITTIGKQWINELEQKEREETKIKNLKINYNKVFGYYIEVTNSQKDLVPFRYVRKQTISNAERYTTDELKLIEDKISNAFERRIELEAKIFQDFRNYLINYINELQKTSYNIALLDVLYSLSQVAVENNYCKPIVSKKIKCLDIKNGRHPIVEKLNRTEDFVPNDTLLDNDENRVMIITGPNMAGKSTYMRQVALITLLAHIGSFVPADSAKISLTDKIFTRIGASDDLSMGQSTFMVEMLEVSNILENATNNSLIILDEVGRGTSTFDGLSIAWSVMEYLSNNLLSKTLFATHFHELTQLEGVLEGVKNYRINVKEYNNSIIFLRKIVRGGASKSFGIEVASLANLPKSVIDRAKEILYSLEENEINKTFNKEVDVGVLEKNIKKANKIISEVKNIDINFLTPINAFEILLQIKNILDKE